ncbi:MAG TPA: hypothetical protein VN936_12545, partial [Candidatus Acidoferrum sp.]|nr:hypothetical protein [Candidatus Acidoferrum sp.]
DARADAIGRSLRPGLETLGNASGGIRSAIPGPARPAAAAANAASDPESNAYPGGVADALGNV